MGSFTKREQIVILVLVIIVVFIAGYNAVNRGIKVDSNTDAKGIEDEEDIDNEDKENAIIMVHITGQVYNPGLVQLESGSRVIDVVNKAGGLTSEADLDRINLARKVADEEKIYIPRIGEDIDEKKEEIQTVQDSGSGEESSSGKVNINIASKEEIMTLPGIGEVLATRIVEYRENNKFATIEDIKNVSGIGDKKFEGIKDLIIVK
jgi:competence protein ComEA